MLAGLRPDRTRIALVGVVALGAATRFVRLGHQSFDFDELQTLHLVQHSFDGMLSTLWQSSESTPPVFYVVEWVWSRIFGTSEAGLRSFSALAGTLTVAVAYAVGRTMLRSRAGGLVVALLTAVAPVLVWYSQESRSYALFVLFGALSLLYFARSLDSPTRRALWLWALCSALAIATHYFAGFLVLAEAAILLPRLGRRALPAAAGIAAVVLALVPLAYHQIHTGGGKWAWFRGNTIAGRLHEVLERFVYFNYNPGRTPLLVVVVAAAAALAFLGRRVGRARAALVVAGLTVGVPLVLAVVGFDIFEYRNLLVAWLPLAVAVAAGIVSIRGSVLRGACVAIAALGLLGCTVMIARRVELQRGSWRTAAGVLERLPGSRVVMPTDVSMLSHYWPSVRDLTAAGARVGEVDVLGQGIAGPAHLGLRLPRFHLAQRLTAGNMTVYRFVDGAHPLVTPSELPWPAVTAG